MEIIKIKQFVGDGKLKYIALVKYGLRQSTGIGLTKEEAIDKAKKRLKN